RCWTTSPWPWATFPRPFREPKVMREDRRPSRIPPGPAQRQRLGLREVSSLRLARVRLVVSKADTSVPRPATTERAWHPGTPTDRTPARAHSYAFPLTIMAARERPSVARSTKVVTRPSTWD